MFMTVPQYEVTWEFPDDNINRGSRTGKLLVSKSFDVPNDVDRLVSILLRNGATSIALKLLPSGPYSIDDITLDSENDDATNRTV